ncbi:MAG: AraC family transcriptional regulator [Anaerolineaceae bacterium]|nr:AraC family transcriptional regulator [Anaerolineaceae bacterium]
MQEKTWTTRGILNPKAGQSKFELNRYLPAPDLAHFVEHYWVIHWDLPTPYEQETISHPCVNMVIERNNTRIYGVVSGKFTRLLEGSGLVMATKFRPGGFYGFLRSPVSTLTDQSVPVEVIFGDDSQGLEAAVLSASDDAAMIAATEDFLRARAPAHDAHVDEINQIIDAIMSDRTITQVDALVNRVNRSARSLQRLFSQYVGVSPKWVIQRYRLQEVTEQLADGQVVDWSRLAQEMGYYDQAHFIKDFKALIGATPAEYTGQIQSADG